MAGYTRYSRAPITEAVIDIRVQLKPNISLEQLSGVNQGQEGAYPNRREHLRVQATFSGGSQVAATARQTPHGYAFTSADERQVYQSRFDGFTFSRFAPYQHWEAFRDEAQRLWQIYRASVQVEKVTRLAVRYINRFDLRVPTELKDFLRTYPELSPDLPQALDAYFMQVQIALPELPGYLIINQTIMPSQPPGAAPIILDVDIFRDSDIPQDDNQIWAFFESLRERKNIVFEACITDKTREMIR